MAFTNADWVGSQTDWKSTTGYCTLVGGNLVSWKSKKQVVTTKSSEKSKYRDVAHGCCELLWLRVLIEELIQARWSNAYLL